MPQQELRTREHAPRNHDDCCKHAQCRSGQRNHYYKGKRLTPEAFRAEQSYFIDRRRLLNRTLHGWGVVRGFGVHGTAGANQQQPSGQVTIGAGLALDACGHELLLVEPVSIAVEGLPVFDARGAASTIEAAPSSRVDPEREYCWVLQAHYAEELSGETALKDPCHCERTEWDRVCETVRFSLHYVDCYECCKDHECGLQCECGSGPCCEEHAERDPRLERLEQLGSEPAPRDLVQEGAAGRIEVPRQADLIERDAEHEKCGPFTRGGCCVCKHVSREFTDEVCCKLSEVKEPCTRVRVDWSHAVPLACVELIKDECGKWSFGAHPNACGPRRTVKSTDLLFDLIRGCDLTRIVEVGWQRFLDDVDDVDFKFFSSALGPDGENMEEYATEDFWVRFSGPVRVNALRPECFRITVVNVEPEGGWLNSVRVPILRVDTTRDTSDVDDPPNTTRRARLVVRGGWLEDAVRGRETIFEKSRRVEIEVFGDLIVDCNGQTVDANSRGRCAAPSGNGTPGGTNFSSFVVSPRKSTTQSKSRQSTPRVQGA